MKNRPSGCLIIVVYLGAMQALTCREEQIERTADAPPAVLDASPDQRAVDHQGATDLSSLSPLYTVEFEAILQRLLKDFWSADGERAAERAERAVETEAEVMKRWGGRDRGGGDETMGRWKPRRR